jgi:hypothetical protein
MASPRERDHRGEALSSAGTRWPSNRQFVPTLAAPPPLHIRRHHFHDTPPWPHQHYHDYALVEGWGWWPRWYPYWDPQWRTYWWHLYDYYGGDGNPEYAEYARDAGLRANAAQWGLVVGSYYETPQIGVQSYGVSAVAARSRHPGTSDQVLAYRRVALDSARKIATATGGLFFGYRDSPWGSELSVFGTRAGLQRWANEQAVDTDVWYAVAFDLSSSGSPLSEVSR